jgi:chromosome partitioning protein
MRTTMARLIAISNQKGGSGKTTTAVNLAAALAEQGRRVLLIDLDPQHSASSWYGIRDAGRGLADLFEGKTNLLDLVSDTQTENVQIIASSAWMIEAERYLSKQVGAETILRTKLARLPDRWDYVLLDTGPALGALTVSGLATAREILVPVESHSLALDGLAQLLETVDVVQERLNPDVRITGILACRVAGRTRHCNEVVDELRSRFGDLVFTTVIRENVRLAEAHSFGQPITEYDTRSAGAADYRALATEVISKEKKAHGRKA